MAKKKTPRTTQQTTLIIVGEGECEKAFLEHLKSLYNERHSGKKIKIDYQGGGSPHDIIKYTHKTTRHISYDEIYILMDSDVTVADSDQKFAKDNRFTILYSTPLCLEGMLLEVLGQPTPTTAQACKDSLYPQLSGNPTQKDSYLPLFDKPTIDNSDHATIAQLTSILSKTYP